MMSSPSQSRTTESSAPVAAFPETQGRTKGYDKRAVDAFLQRAKASFDGPRDDADALTAADIRAAAFPLTRHGAQPSLFSFPDD